MKEQEIITIAIAIITLTITAGIYFAFQNEFGYIPMILLFSAIIILVNVFAKKSVAYLLDANVEHELWSFRRFGYKPGSKLKWELPFGIIIPLVFSIITLGVLKIMTFITYETRAKKSRASKKYGYYSFTEMTDWSNGLIGSGGIIALIILAIIVYLIPINGIEYLSKMSIYYAFWNLIPFSKLDGTQIFFGSKTIWTTLAVITAILTAVAILI